MVPLSREKGWSADSRIEVDEDPMVAIYGGALTSELSATARADRLRATGLADVGGGLDKFGLGRKTATGKHRRREPIGADSIKRRDQPA